MMPTIIKKNIMIQLSIFYLILTENEEVTDEFADMSLNEKVILISRFPWNILFYLCLHMLHLLYCLFLCYFDLTSTTRLWFVPLSGR